MEPIIFNGHAGWLHEADGDCGVVLCNPLGHEAMWLHQAMRQLADCLAARGVTVLRFDYLGTGDSADNGAWVRPADWVAEVVDAVSWLRQATPVTRVSLAGFRFGAMIAALAARQVEVDSLALFAPVVSARLFLREMNFLHQTWRRKAGLADDAAPPPDGTREIFGHLFSADGLDALAAFDLASGPRPSAGRVLIAHSGQNDGSDTLASRLAAQDVPVESIEFVNYTQTLCPPWMTEAPAIMLNAAADWLSRHDGTPAAPAVATPRAGARPHPGMPVPGGVERPVRAGEGRLAGILCEPMQAGDTTAPALLIANTGATHHVGDGRFGVELAREMVCHGYASLRVDADGIGDSAGAGQARGPGQIPYESMAADLAAWVDWLAARGYRQIVIFGICAGAYTALVAARKHLGIRGLILVNPASFLLPENCTILQAAQNPRGSARANLRSMTRADKWTKVLRGELSLRPAARTLWRHAMTRVQRHLAALSNDRLFATTSSHQVHRQFRRLDAAGVRVRLLFSPKDHALDEFYMHFGGSRRKLGSLPRLDALVLENVDHEVLNRRAREDVITECFALLQEIFLAVRREHVRPAAAGAQTEFTLT
ncbi:MAG: alpha/beta fold hydrolase [Burkholderia sp.]